MLDTVTRTSGDVQRRQLSVELLDSHPHLVPSPVTADEPTAPPEDVLRLLGVHLPTVDNDGVLNWNEAAGEGSRRPNFEQLQPILQTPEHRRGDLPADDHPVGEVVG